MANTKKQAVITAYVDLAQSLTRASVAISDYAHALGVAHDPEDLSHLVANPPALPFFGAAGVRDEDDNKKGKKEKKAKKVKDPNAPKRPASAYLEYQNAVRQQFRDNQPGLSYAEVLRKIAETWQNMSPEDKQQWNDITAAKTKTWEAAKAAYHPAEGDIAVAAAAAANSAATTVGKDGKEYTGKKRGRKSNAEKALAAAEEESGVIQALQNAVDQAPASKKKDKKVVAAPKPESSEEEDSDSDSSSSEVDSDEDSDEDEVEEEIPIAPPAKASKANGSKKDKSEKPKSKKSRTA